MTRRSIFLTLLAALLCMAPASATTRKNKFVGYLFAYFEGTGEGKLQEQLRFAISKDASDWYALNDNRPVVGSDSISTSGGIRDPHILRGNDGCFYIVATDMNTAANGWKDNPGIVMLKSKDLTHWSHAKIVLKDAYKNFADAYWVWAPQTIYDRKAKKYMVYFTLQRTGDGRKSLVTYYAYANKDFSGFESEPKVLFSAKYGSIDNDIIERNGVYHLFYKGNIKNAEGKEIQNGIQQATSKSLTGPWKEDFKFIDAYANAKTGVEGSGVFPLNDGSGYVLMYDLFGSGRYEYQTSADLKTFSSKPQSFRKDFFPRHGTVIPITEDEMDRLQQQWGYVMQHDYTATGNPIFTHERTADPAALVKNDTLWLFTGIDEPGNHSGYAMRKWAVFSTTDLRHWTEYPTPLRVSDFKWASSKQAYAGHVVERNGKYYWYVSTNWCGIGVAVADKITGPYRDALGKPLLTNDDCFASSHSWACIDPAVYIDNDGTPYIIWGNGQCYIAKLKDSMTEIVPGSIRQIDLGTDYPFTEAPWVHQYNGKYYLTYASGWPEKIAYAMADNMNGPWKPMGIISEIAGNSNTTHPAIVNLRDQWLFISHNGALPDGDGSHRSVIIENMAYRPDGSIKPIAPTAKGVSAQGNPILNGYHADPEILYSNKTQRYYIYSTTDGKPGWGGWQYYAYSSADLKDWRCEGVVLDAKNGQIPWANGNLWAPAAEEVKTSKGYKYFLYYSAQPKDGGRKMIGVAVADNPTGPFTDLGHPLLSKEPEGFHGQLIDVDVFTDPVSKKPYLYWGNSMMAGAELNADMTSIKEETTTLMTPQGGSLRDYAYREAPYVFYRNGLYYFMWSVDDTGSPNYHVAYGTATSPLGPIKVADKPIVLQQDAQRDIYGTAHNAVIQVPGTDEWYIVYHRINKDWLRHQPGVHRETCIDRLYFNEDGTIKPVVPTD